MRVKVRAPQVHLPKIDWRKWLLPVAVAVMLLYTFDQLWNGERGLVTWRLMHEQVRKLKADNDALQADVDHLHLVTERMKAVKDEDGRKHSMDEDFVDEMIRRFLPLRQPGEKILLP